MLGLLIIELIKEIYKFIKNKKMDFKYSKGIMEDKKIKIKFIKKEIISDIKRESENPFVNTIIKNNFGLTISDNVEVRSSSKVSSPIVYKLRNVGEIVIIINKNKKWTKIKFEGQDNKEYIGWVFTRYIDKITD